MTTDQTIAGMQTIEEKINGALTRTLAEFGPVMGEARTNMTWYLFLLDQTTEKVPDAHPMQVAEMLYTRLVPSSESANASSAFKMGMLAAQSLRSRTADHNEKLKKELAERQRFQQAQPAFPWVAPK